MASANKLAIERKRFLSILPTIIVSIFSIIILSYSFYIGMLLWGLMAVFQVIFIFVLVRIAFYIREYIELNKKHIELCNGYLMQKLKQSDNEIEPCIVNTKK